MARLPFAVLLTALAFTSGELVPSVGEAVDDGCKTMLLNVALYHADLTGLLMQSYYRLMEPTVAAIPEKVLLFVVWDFVDATVRLFEGSYQAACRLLACGSCASEAWNSSSLVLPELVDRFDRVADGLWLFLDLFDKVRKHVDIFDRMRTWHEAEDSAEEEIEEISTRLPAESSRASVLRVFLKEVPEGRTLATLEDLMPSVGRKGAVSEEDWCLTLMSTVNRVQKNVTEAMHLASAVIEEYRRVPGFWGSFDVPSHLAYLEGAIRENWFSDLMAFIQNFPDGHSRSEMLFARNSSLCPSDSRLQSSSPSSGVGSMRLPSMDATRYLSWRARSPKSLLEQVAAAGHRLSYTYWSVHSVEMKKPTCNTTVEILYDPTTCLEDEGWSGFTYLEASDPTYEDSGGSRFRPRPWQGKQVNTTFWGSESLRTRIVAPLQPLDVVVLSPLIGNCRLLSQMLRAESMTISKLVYMPINPLLPPPLKAEPNFTHFLEEFWMNDESPYRFSVTSGRENVLAQCSLSTAVELLTPLSYELLHVEHLFAVFVHRAFAHLFGRGPGTVSPYEEWRLGWFCSPLSRFFFGLEAAVEFDVAELLVDPYAAGVPESTACRFLRHLNLAPSSFAHNCGSERVEPLEALPFPPSSLRPGLARRLRLDRAKELHPGRVAGQMLRSEGRAVCYDDKGVCDCMVPYRGPLCLAEERSSVDDARPFRGAIHYIVNEGDEHLAELFFGLENLYATFNDQKEYPVLIFHDGLTAETRERIVLRAPHRIWFFWVHDWFPAGVDETSELHSTFGLGYMAQSRFRSGPLFNHPAVQSFDYLLGLDSDSHFPSRIEKDPFEELHGNPELVMGISHITMTSPASVLNLWEHTMLYAMKENIDIWSQDLFLKRDKADRHFLFQFLNNREFIGLERVPSWNYRVVMTDCELLRLSFFRGKESRYAEYFSYLDSLDGFWLHRWGDHAVRTLGVGMALWKEDRQEWILGLSGRGSRSRPRVFTMDMPYAHQDYCSCGAANSTCKAIHDPKKGLVLDRLKVLGKRYWRCEA